MLAPLAASLVQQVISSVVKGISGGGVRRAERRFMNKKFLFCSILSIINHFNYEPRFKGVFSRNNLPGIKDGAYVINLNDNNSKGTHWVSLFIDKNTAVYFDSFETEHIPQRVLTKIKDKSIIHNIFRIQDNKPIMSGFYCIALIEYMLSEKTLLAYTNLLSPNDYKRNDKIIYKYFKDKYGRRSKSRV